VTNRKCSGSAVLRSVVGLLLCFGILVGSAFSLVMKVNALGFDIVIEAGDYKVGMYWLDGKENPVGSNTGWKNASGSAMFTAEKDLWEPGCVLVRHVKIANEGDGAISYSLVLRPQEEGGEIVIGELADVIDVYYLDEKSVEPINGRGHKIFSDSHKLGTLAEFLKTVEQTAAGTLDAGSEHVVTIALKMRESADNTYQGKSIGSGFNVVLVATATN